MYDLELQKAVMARLRSDAGVQALVSNPDATSNNGVYDYVPAVADGGNDAYFPYITFVEAANTNFDTDTTDGFETVFMIHVWSRKRAITETKKLMNAVYDSLHKHDLVVTGYNVLTLHLENSESMRGSDGLTNHGFLRFRTIAIEV